MPPPKKPVDPNRQLMIKTKTCQRIRKELDYYIQEVQDNEQQLDDMKHDASKDPYDIRRFAQVVDESKMMVPDAQRRLRIAVEDLQSFLTSSSTIPDDSEWKGPAEEILLRESTAAMGNDEPGEAPVTNVEDLAEGEAF
mmetsp:Transcript_20554/g.56740  ORF Transcript_20554/g.56740 Transcript_20554/m.56740 type:complete len:139 (+) Transcript_20554:117-533(+)